MTQSNEQQIIDDYLSQTMFIKDICTKYHISTYIFNTILKKNNIQKYDSHFLYPQNQRKFPLNETYFDTQSSEMAYILGFLAADGTVRKATNEIKLTLAAVDVEFLELLQQKVGGRPIKVYEDSKGYKNATWSFSSRHIKEALAKYNIVPQKTNTFTFPQNLEKNYWIDFIRGYFDGDGSVSTAGQSAIRWQLCSKNPDVLQVVIHYFKEFDIPEVSIYKRQDGLYYFQYSNTATRKIFEILYYPNCLCLKRKYQKFLSLI